MATHANITKRGFGAGATSVTVARQVEVLATQRITYFYQTTTPQERAALYWYRVANAPHAFKDEIARPKRRLSGGALNRYMRKRTRMTDTDWQVALYEVGRVLAQF